MYIDSESELRKIGSQAKKIVLKDFAGKFGALFFIWFGYKIDAPICSPPYVSYYSQTSSEV